MSDEKHVVIVGGGVAGLLCARELAQHPCANNKLRITLLEAAAHLGGRLCGNAWTDYGAEFIHGTQTLLTELLLSKSSDDDDWEEIFITAHADGGPDSEPTRDGKHGMYYMNGKLIMYNDSCLEPLNTALQEILSNSTRHQKDVSVVEALEKYDLSADLLQLAHSSFANTAGGPLEELSVHMLSHFEAHWESNEQAGDYRLRRKPLYSIVSLLLQQIQDSCHDTNVELDIVTDAKVTSIRHSDSSTQRQLLEVATEAGTVYQAVSAVVVTIPPPLYAELELPLLAKMQREALSFTGYASHAVKIVVQLSRRLWPANVQSVVCAATESDQDVILVPELWFRGPLESSPHGSVWLATAFLTSTAAEHFVKRLVQDERERDEQAVLLFLQQLAHMFDAGSLQDWKDAVVDSVYTDWHNHSTIRGGYMFPRVGMTTQHLQALATPTVLGRDSILALAGEATNANACCTVQAAMETGKRAAQQVSNFLRG